MLKAALQLRTGLKWGQHQIQQQQQQLLILTSTLHSSSLLSSKSDLANLRKKTGYSLSVCKKALTESNNDPTKAEQWLREQAQAQGWAKAQKLQGRNTTQGLLGLRVLPSKAVLVELNCETDFVARNKKFLSLLDSVNETFIDSDKDGEPLKKTSIPSSDVGQAKTREGKSLADLLALNIGQIGENLALGVVDIYEASPESGIKLAGLSHPNIGVVSDKLQYGRYAAIMAFTVTTPGLVPKDTTLETLAKQICQHIIGMAPTCLDNEDDKEGSLLHQPFLLDEDIKVGELAQSAGISILHFVRREVGRGA